MAGQQSDTNPPQDHLGEIDQAGRAALAQLGDQRWRLCNLYYIIPKEGARKIKFQPNWAQLMVLDELWFNDAILKARQLGLTTLINLLSLDSALFTPDFAAFFSSCDMTAVIKNMRRNIITAYESLPDGIRLAIPETGRAMGANPYIRFANGSRIEGGLSARGDSYQLVHVSELGKTAVKYPARAGEVFTGSMQAVLSGKGLRIVESTMEGEEGAFAALCQSAIEATAAAHAEQRSLSHEEYKLIFLPWWRHPEYQADPATVIVSPEDRKYFAEIEAKAQIKLTDRQIAWYVAKLHSPEMGIVKMRKEYPSTPEEAFAGSSEGTVYGEQMAIATARGRLTVCPVLKGVPVDTSWDLGIDDYTVIWLWQWHGQQLRSVGYIEGSGREWGYYAQQLWEWRQDGVVFGRHYLPHDGRNRQGETGKRTADILEEAGVRPIEIVDTPDKAAGVNQARSLIGVVQFDAESCKTGITHLRRHRKEWSERLGAYVDRPRHDEHSHACDALRIYAQATDGGRLYPGGIKTKRTKYPRSAVA